VVALKGSVVIVPLVGCEPLHPPEAVQACTPVALHCNVADVPMATLELFATRDTVGFGAAAAGAVARVSETPTPEEPQAASNGIAMQLIAQRNGRNALRNCQRRPTEFIRYFPCNLFATTARCARQRASHV
jgi:hypothetical protein